MDHSSGRVPDTPVSLLLRLKQRGLAEDWARFVDIYGPVIYTWARRRSLQTHDAANLSQDVLAQVSSSIGWWHHDPERGPFRAWLFALTRNKTIDLLRRARRRPEATDDGRTGFVRSSP